MDPVTEAIIIEASKQGITSAYQGIKYLLSQKFGPQSKVVRATEELKDDPSSLGRRTVLLEEVKKAQADKDYDLLQQANHILKINQSSLSQTAGGNIVQGGHVAAGGNIIYGHPGVVALVAVIIVAIFALLIWQAFPLLRNAIVSVSSQTQVPKSTTVSTSNQTQIPESTPGATIIALCQFSRLNRADWIYQLYTTESFQNEVSGSEFTKQWNGMGFSDECTLNNIKKSDDTATGDLHVQRSSGTSDYTVTFKKALSQDSNGKPLYAWMIDKLQPK